MKKLMNPKEWLGTGIQLMLFGLLIPFISIILGIINLAAPGAMAAFADSVISMLPMADTIQDILLAYNVSDPAMSTLEYISVVLKSVTDDMITATYLGMWLYAFKLIFKELLGDIIRLRGIPIIQVSCGLFFGALTYPMLDETLTAALATAFLVVLNVVLIIIVGKPGWKKWLDILFGLGVQCIHAGLSIGYFTTVFICCKGLLTVTASILVFIVVTAVWLSLLAAQYFTTDK